MSDLKSKQIFDASFMQDLTNEDINKHAKSEPVDSKQTAFNQYEFKSDESSKAGEQELNSRQLFSDNVTFTPAPNLIKEQQDAEDGRIETQLAQVIRPKKGRSWFAISLLSAFSGLVAWQALDSVWTAYLNTDWLTLAWSGFISLLASFGIGAIIKELWKLRRLRHHFSLQEQGEALSKSHQLGKGKEFCQSIAKESGINAEHPAYDRWFNTIKPSHNDAEILDMYDAIVVSEQDKQAVNLVSKYSTEAAALVAVSPLAITDMLFVAWRNFKMLDKLAELYGIELGYWSRLALFKTVLINMAAVGVSEVAIDASADVLSMDLTKKISMRAGQGIGVGILTARLGLKAMTLLRPLPWHPERTIKIGAIRQKIVAKLTSIVIK